MFLAKVFNLIVIALYKKKFEFWQAESFFDHPSQFQNALTFLDLACHLAVQKLRFRDESKESPRLNFKG